MQDDIFETLLNKQKTNLDPKRRLEFKDIKRLTKYIDFNFFSPDECCHWRLTPKATKPKKYITFYFNGKKVSLYRLLYYNFVGDINDNEYIRLSCGYKGSCVNYNHFNKFLHKPKVFKDLKDSE